jgi:hypothetical protein
LVTDYFFFLTPFTMIWWTDGVIFSLGDDEWCLLWIFEIIHWQTQPWRDFGGMNKDTRCKNFNKIIKIIKTFTQTGELISWKSCLKLNNINIMRVLLIQIKQQLKVCVLVLRFNLLLRSLILTILIVHMFEPHDENSCKYFIALILRKWIMKRLCWVKENYFWKENCWNGRRYWFWFRNNCWIENYNIILSTSFFFFFYF